MIWLIRKWRKRRARKAEQQAAIFCALHDKIKKWHYNALTWDDKKRTKLYIKFCLNE